MKAICRDLWGLRAWYGDDRMTTTGTKERTAQGSNRVILHTNALPARIEMLKKAGLVCRNEMESAPDGKQIQIGDPDGNPIELFEPAR